VIYRVAYTWQELRAGRVLAVAGAVASAGEAGEGAPTA